MLKTIGVRTNHRIEFVNVTSSVQTCVKESGITSGICVVFVPHTTAGVTINENADPDVRRDITAHLSKMVPESGSFAHIEGNSDAHIKASLVGLCQTIVVEKGRLVLGTWQSIYFCEFDGPRNRSVHVKVMQG